MHGSRGRRTERRESSEGMAVRVVADFRGGRKYAPKFFFARWSMKDIRSYAVGCYVFVI